MQQPASIPLFVYEQTNSKSCEWNVMKFSGNVNNGPRIRCLNVCNVLLFLSLSFSISPERNTTKDHSGLWLDHHDSKKHYAPYCYLPKTQLHFCNNVRIVKCHLRLETFFSFFTDIFLFTRVGAYKIGRWFVLKARAVYVASLAVSSKHRSCLWMKLFRLPVELLNCSHSSPHPQTFFTNGIKWRAPVHEVKHLLGTAPPGRDQACAWEVDRAPARETAGSGLSKRRSSPGSDPTSPSWPTSSPSCFGKDPSSVCSSMLGSTLCFGKCQLGLVKWEQVVLSYNQKFLQ